MTYRMVQAAFWLALATTFIFATMPAEQVPHLVPWDKAEHFLAFYVLAVLGAMALPKRTLFVIGLGLSAFGALIEIVQAIPALQRDASFWDWVADTLAIAAALVPSVLVRARAWMRLAGEELARSAS